jgi:hypothetical protein
MHPAMYSQYRYVFVFVFMLTPSPQLLPGVPVSGATKVWAICITRSRRVGTNSFRNLNLASYFWQDFFDIYEFGCSRALTWSSYGGNTVFGLPAKGVSPGPGQSRCPSQTNSAYGHATALRLDIDLGTGRSLHGRNERFAGVIAFETMGFFSGNYRLIASAYHVL